MITILVHELNQHTVDRLLKTAGNRLSGIQKFTYQQAFRSLSVPAGTLIFTDFDYLNGIEMDAAAAMANAASAANPEIKILNHPSYACERYELLKRLHARGLNPIEITRLDGTELPSRYPVFIRLEDGAWGPESGLINTEHDLVKAVDELKISGFTPKRRVAVSFEGKKDKDGYYRKYGAFRIGDAIIPQHILRGRKWVVKSRSKTFDEAFVEEEFGFVQDNPHREQLLELCELVGLQYGRVDYNMVDGAPVIFEINPNPIFPRFEGGNPAREERRRIILNRLKLAFDAIDTPVGNHRPIQFRPPQGRLKFMRIGRRLRARRYWDKLLRRKKKRAGSDFETMRNAVSSAAGEIAKIKRKTNRFLFRIKQLVLSGFQ